MTEVYITLRGEDADEFEAFRDQLDDAIAGGVESNTQAVRAAIDLADSQLDGRR